MLSMQILYLQSDATLYRSGLWYSDDQAILRQHEQQCSQYCSHAIFYKYLPGKVAGFSKEGWKRR